jgi:hypothetical protein
VIINVDQRPAPAGSTPGLVKSWSSRIAADFRCFENFGSLNADT